MNKFIAVQPCVNNQSNNPYKDSSGYEQIQLKFIKNKILLDKLEFYCQRIKTENSVLIEMVREERNNVDLIKEELKKSKNKLEQEKKLYEIRTDLEARISDQTKK